MISTNDFQTGMTIKLDGEVHSIVDFEHSKSGRGGAFVRTRLRNLETGQVFNKTFRAGEKVERAHVETREMQFLYRSGEEFVFMDMETYEQITLMEDYVGEMADLLRENQELAIQFHEDRPIGIKLPPNVVLEVKSTQPGVRGDTVSGGNKPATLETGAVIQVPLFINEGDKVRVDTRKKEYMERV